MEVGGIHPENNQKNHTTTLHTTCISRPENSFTCTVKQKSCYFEDTFTLNKLQAQSKTKETLEISILLGWALQFFETSVKYLPPEMV